MPPKKSSQLAFNEFSKSFRQVVQLEIRNEYIRLGGLAPTTAVAIESQVQKELRIRWSGLCDDDRTEFYIAAGRDPPRKPAVVAVPLSAAPSSVLPDLAPEAFAHCVDNRICNYFAPAARTFLNLDEGAVEDAS
jgi:hypothetical protein